MRKAAAAFARLIVVMIGLGGCAIAVFLVVIVVISWPNFWATLLLGVIALFVFASGAFMVFRGIWGAAENSESTAQEFFWELMFRILFESVLGG